MTYELVLSELAQDHLLEWAKSGQKKILKKISDLFDELRQHPKTGTGKVEQLKGNLTGYWSRHITKGDRIIYTIVEDKVIVDVVSLKGHYNDK